ncbi:hypothetical protein K474DRAFT_1680250 [Panus rudis PR-1116 ss-1]|nr:hypothetical protein K474DRAFT_1680250 [Panus rudis PR-1116 ss-1]
MQGAEFSLPPHEVAARHVSHSISDQKGKFKPYSRVYSIPRMEKKSLITLKISKAKGKEREHTPVPTEPTPQAPQDKNIPDTDMSWSHIPPTQTEAASVAPPHRTARNPDKTISTHAQKMAVKQALMDKLAREIDEEAKEIAISVHGGTPAPSLRASSVAPSQVDPIGNKGGPQNPLESDDVETLAQQNLAPRSSSAASASSAATNASPTKSSRKPLRGKMRQDKNETYLGRNTEDNGVSVNLCAQETYFSRNTEDSGVSVNLCARVNPVRGISEHKDITNDKGHNGKNNNNNDDDDDNDDNNSDEKNDDDDNHNDDLDGDKTGDDDNDNDERSNDGDDDDERSNVGDDDDKRSNVGDDNDERSNVSDGGAKSALEGWGSPKKEVE